MESSVSDVLSGNKALQFEISIDIKTTALLATALFVAVLGALVIYKKL
jgi:hypothetical protein